MTYRTVASFPQASGGVLRLASSWPTTKVPRTMRSQMIGHGGRSAPSPAMSIARHMISVAIRWTLPPMDNVVLICMSVSNRDGLVVA